MLYAWRVAALRRFQSFTRSQFASNIAWWPGCSGFPALVLGMLLWTLSAFAQTTASTGQITGVVKIPIRQYFPVRRWFLPTRRPRTSSRQSPIIREVYTFPGLQPGTYVVEVDAKGFKPSVSTELKVRRARPSNPILLWRWPQTRRP